MSDTTNSSSAISPNTGVLPMLVCAGAANAVDFYGRAFGAVEEYRMNGESGKIMHCRLALNGGLLFLNDDFPEFRGGEKTPPPAATTLHLQVADPDAWWERAVAAGATVVMPIGDQFWGDRYGQLKDPWGHLWSIGGPIKG